jgi:hypothetical protein
VRFIMTSSPSLGGRPGLGVHAEQEQVGMQATRTSAAAAPVSIERVNSRPPIR